jgi:hypothetical protein
MNVFSDKPSHQNGWSPMFISGCYSEDPQFALPIPEDECKFSGCVACLASVLSNFSVTDSSSF